MMWEKQPCRHQGQWTKEGEEVLKMPQQRVFPCSSWWRPWWGRLPSCSPWEVHSGADIHLQPMEGTPHWSRWMPEGSCDPVRSPRWSRLLSGPVKREEPNPEQVCWQGLGLAGGPRLEQAVPEGLHPVGRTHTGAVREKLHPVGRIHIGEVCGELFPVRGTSHWSRGRVWGVLPLRDKD